MAYLLAQQPDPCIDSAFPYVTKILSRSICEFKLVLLLYMKD